MTQLKPLAILPRAEEDIYSALHYYRTKAGLVVGKQWAEAVESTLRNIQVHSLAGSPGYSAILDIENLRHWIVPGFPYIVFYYNTPETIEVWRVLHSQRDIRSTLRDEFGPYN